MDVPEPRTRGFSVPLRMPRFCQPRRYSARFILLSCVLLLLSGVLRGQGTDLIFRRIAHEQGLSQSLVLCMLQDHRGFMWIGTEDGLNRFDGCAFVTHRNDPVDTNSLSNSYIWSLYEDSHGLLWIGTWGGGLNCYDPVRDTFVRYQHDPADTTSIAHNRVTSICEDTAGCLWVCTAGGGLDRFDPATRRFTHMRSLLSALPQAGRNDLFCMTQSQDGALWIGTYFSGLIRIDAKNGTTRLFRHNPGNPRSLSDNRILSLCETADGDLWVGTWEGGLNLLHPATGDCERFMHHPDDAGSLPGNIVRSLLKDDGGNLWVGTIGGGAAWLDRSRGIFTRYAHSPFVPTSLSDNVVTSIFRDAGGTLWFGTASGLSINAPSAHKFPVYRSMPGIPGSLQGKRVYALCSDSLGSVWIGTEDAGLHQLDPATGKIRNFVHDPANPRSLPYNYVSALMTDTRGEVWVGTYGGGLARFDRSRGAFRRYVADPRNTSRRLNAYISSLLEDRTGNIWVGTWIAGLALIDRDGRILRTYAHGPDPGSLPDNDIRCLALDRTGAVWVGTAKGGLSRYDPSSDRFQDFGSGEKVSGGAGREYVQAIAEDHWGRLWLGTFGGGLTLFDPAHGTWSHYAVQQGLPNNVVYGVLEDRQHRFWLSTNEGISCCDPDRMTFRNYTRHDGLQADEFNFNAYSRSPDGALYFGGVNGVNVVMPDRVAENRHVPPVVFTGFRIFDRQMNTAVAPFAATEVTLDYDENFITIEYAALDYALPERNRYAYRLEGMDRGWVDAGARRSASYTGLAPGAYTFRVRGANNDGIWNEKGAALTLTVHPPFWQTFWFRFLVGAILLTGVLYAYHLRVESLLKVERMRLRIASDLHDEIGSSLASIAVLADLVRKRAPLPPAEADHLQDISHAARTTSDALRDIVWFVNPEHDSTINIIDRLRGISATLLAGIPYTVYVDDHTPSDHLPMVLRRDIVLIYKELLSNIVRHADAQHVDIRFAVRHGRFRLEVRDDGKGFDPAAPSAGNGLLTMRRRAAGLGASFDIRSEPAGGTVVCLEGKIP
jgi:ligand-binding sensor domain-containing protein/signal transduction histidine kinase